MSKIAPPSPKSVVKRLLKERPEVRPFPAAVSQLLSVCQDPSSTAEMFEDVIKCDPALAVRVLRMSNSPLFGMAREVTSVAHATAILGIRQLKNLALSVAGASMFATGESTDREREELWRHSLACASVGRLLCRFVPSVSPEDAFLAGIFHDIGKLFFFDIVPKEYRALLSKFEACEVLDEERKLFGVTHQEIGLKSAHSWKLPENVKVAIGFHHFPSEAEVHIQLVSLTSIANSLAKSWNIGTTDAPYVELDDEMLESLSLPRDAVDSLEDQAHELFNDSSEAFKSA